MSELTAQNALRRLRSSVQRKNLRAIVKDLIRRREEHEQRIEKLLTSNYRYEDPTKASGFQEFSEVLRKLEGDQPQQGLESMQLLANAVVNLLASVSLKTEYHLIEKQELIKEKGMLYQSLLQKFDTKKISFHTFEGNPQNLSQWLKQLCQYLVNEGLVDGLFTSFQQKNDEMQYYGTYFDCGKYSQIHLSARDLQQDEFGLIVECHQQNKNEISITWLLLKRLLSNFSLINFPFALHRLFGFPYRHFLIRESFDMLAFNNMLSLLQKNQYQNNTKIYGMSEYGQVQQLKKNQQNNLLKNFVSLIHKFRSILVICQLQLPLKHIPLSCLRNHFVVVTLTTIKSGIYYISVGSLNKKQKFRICILDSSRNIVQYDKICNSQFMITSLSQQQYQIYIMPQATQQSYSSLEQSFQLVKENQEQFSLWIQGKSVNTKYGELLFDITLKQRYNQYTMAIAQTYIAKEKIQLEKNKINELIVVRRYILKVMELVVDQFIVSDQKVKKLIIRYKYPHLCDRFFQEQNIEIPANTSLVLREQTQFEVTFQAVGAKLPFKIIRFFL